MAHAQRRERPDVTDVKVVVRKDRRKLDRVRYLLAMKAQIDKVTDGKELLEKASAVGKKK